MTKRGTTKLPIFSNVYYKKFKRTSLCLVIFVCFIWVLSEIFFFVKREKKLNKDNNKIEEVYIKKDINSIINKIKDVEKKQNNITKERTKTKANIVYNISLDISKDKNISDKRYAKLLTKKINKIVPGNFFIADLKGQTLYASKGIKRTKKNIEKELVFLNNKSEDFIKYTTKEENQFFSYIKKLKHKNWYVGYIEKEDIAKQQKTIIAFIEKKFTKKNTFIYNTKGMCIYHNKSKHRIAKHFSAFADSTLSKNLKGILIKLQNNRQTKIISYDNNNFKIKKNSYLTIYNKWNWVIGATFYENLKSSNIKSSIKKNRYSFFNKILILTTTLLLTIFICNIIFARVKNQLTKNIKTLKTFFTKNTTQTNKHIIEELKYSEFIEIAQNINAMINKRIHKENKLKKATEKAIESDLLKSSFLANMSHEIRTPLNSIMGFSNLLEKDDFSKEDKAEFCANIKHSGELLLYLINDIIDISKIESGSINISLDTTNIDRILRELDKTFNLIKEKREKNNIEIITINKLSKSIIHSDHIRLKQILSNLIDNALKFTETGSITITAENLENKDILFKVKDTGIGINEKAQKYIFERFYQVDTNKNRRFSGTGLGLAISSKLSILLGGKIWVESEPGKGSCFNLIIPYITNNKKEEIVNSEMIIF